MKLKDILTESFIQESVTFFVPGESNYGMGPCTHCKDGVDGYTLDVGDDHFYFDEKPTSSLDLTRKMLNQNPTVDKIKKRMRGYTIARDAQTNDEFKQKLQDAIDDLKLHYGKLKKKANRIAKNNMRNIGPDECRACNGSGESEQELSDVPELNVANDNARIVVDMMGLEFDHSGEIKPEQIPVIKRRLLKIKNQGGDAYTRDDEYDDGDRGMQRTKDSETGVTTISRKKGLKMYGQGVDTEKVMRYVDEMLKVLDYAQKKNSEISWG